VPEDVAAGIVAFLLRENKSKIIQATEPGTMMAAAMVKS
jgi:hypothetical protein